MSKSKTKTLTPAVMSEPPVTHNINMNMSSADLIELYIEENVERITKEMQLTLDELKSLKTQPRRETPENIRKLILKNLKIKGFKFTKADYTVDSIQGSAEKCPSVGISIGIDESITARQILGYAHIDCWDTAIYAPKHQICTVSLFVYNSISKSYDVSVALRREALPEKLLELLDPLVNFTNPKEYYEKVGILLRKIYELHKEYQEVNNTRKTRAKFTKKVLAQTEQGKKLLNFISSGSMKLIVD